MDDISVIKAITELPIWAVLIFLLIREQMKNEKLLAELIASEREHARNLVDIAVGRVRPAISMGVSVDPKRDGSEN